MKTQKIYRPNTPLNYSHRAIQPDLTHLPSKKNQNPLNKTSYMLKPMKKQAQNLSKKSTQNERKPKTVFQETFSISRNKDELSELDRRSSLSQVQQFIVSLIRKSQQSELTSTQKYMLSGYIDIFIKEAYQPNQLKDNSYTTVEKLKQQWIKLTNIWQLFKIKQNKSKTNSQSNDRKELIENNYKILQQQISKIQNRREKMEQVKKLMKKFYTDLIN